MENKTTNECKEEDADSLCISQHRLCKAFSYGAFHSPQKLVVGAGNDVITRLTMFGYNSLEYQLLPG